MSEYDTIIFNVDEASDLPIWAQLRNRIAYLIRTGYFAPGDQLPSVRAMAADAGINYNTVTRAYRDLELSGLVHSARGRGMFVLKPDSAEDDNLVAADSLLDNCVEQYRACGMSFEDIRARIEGRISQRESAALALEEERRQYGNRI